jgi:glycosyltransferase involved in cell wall biosynthesis
MQVILGSDAIHRPLTGIGRYALELARHLREKPEVERLDFFSMGRWQTWQDLQACEMPVAPVNGHINASPPKTLRSVLASNALAVRVYETLTPALYAWRLRNKADALFHSPNYFLPQHQGPCVATIHDLSHVWHPQFHPQVRVDYMNRALEQSLNRADFLITDTESVRREVISHFAWPADKVAAVALGVDSLYHPRSAVELAPVLNRWNLSVGGYTLYVGTVEPRKNLGELLRAYEQLCPAIRKRWPLVIVGSKGWDSAAVHNHMNRAATQGWLHYLNYVPQQYLPFLYSGARLFVYPSLYEGFGLPPLEAMASGVPVVCSDVSSLAELVRDAANIVHPHDTKSLLAALSKGLTDDDWQNTMKTKGIARAKLFSWQACASRTLDVYKACELGHPSIPKLII